MQKNATVENYIRQQIGNGVWRPGDKLPSEQEMCAELSVSQTTLRIALKTLANDGWIERKARSGSFVCEKTSKQNIFIVCPLAQITQPTGYHFRFLIERLQQKIQQQGYVANTFLSSEMNRDDVPCNLDELVRNPAFRDCGGIIGLTSLEQIRQEIQERNIACVEMLSGAPLVHSGTIFDLDHKNRTAFRVLKQHGITDDIAVLYPDFTSYFNQAYNVRKEFIEPLLQRAGEAGITLDETWLVPVAYSERRQWAEAYTVMKEFWQNCRRKPKAVFFALDTVAIAALPAILELGIKVPEELSLITHANHQEEFSFPVKLEKVVFDLAQTVDTAWELLTRQLNGDNAVTMVRIPAQSRPGESLQWRETDSGALRLRHSGWEVLRPGSRQAGLAPWKRVSCYAFADGPEMYAVDSDVWGEDRYGNFLECFSAPGSENRYRRLSEMENGQFVPTLMELFIGLDPVANTVWRGFTSGGFDRSLPEREGHRQFSRNGNLVLEASRNGGGVFRQVLNVTHLAESCGIPGRMVTSCGGLAVTPKGRLLFPFYAEDFETRQRKCELVVLTGEPEPGPHGYRWEFSDPIRGHYRGRDFDLTESALTVLADGRVICVARAENTDANGIPSYKWITESADGGKSWTPVRPLCLRGGREIFSPSSNGYLITHSSGAVFYIANFFERQQDCQGCGPRYRLTIARLDPETLELDPDSLLAVDERQPDELPELAVSNFWVWEDRQTRELCIDAPRAFAHKVWLGDIELRRTRLKVM